MKTILGILMILGGVVLGVWLGVWVMFIGGIVQLIQSITPVVIAKGIACGVARILFSGAVGWVSALVLIGTGVTLLKD